LRLSRRLRDPRQGADGDVRKARTAPRGEPRRRPPHLGLNGRKWKTGTGLGNILRLVREEEGSTNEGRLPNEHAQAGGLRDEEEPPPRLPLYVAPLRRLALLRHAPRAREPLRS